ncbi:uncharacterized protein KRP23_6868 [Phytophthora ramorum]|uniref:uncharacterized protein n=1 Tax=Phytophthora ramorum TaxID=164328 RepID=UPI0030A9237C|nr:hypothetical protein KRP23_6868 [Phytophthora ramorum]
MWNPPAGADSQGGRKMPRRRHEPRLSMTCAVLAATTVGLPSRENSARSTQAPAQAPASKTQAPAQAPASKTQCVSQSGKARARRRARGEPRLRHHD